MIWQTVSITSGMATNAKHTYTQIYDWDIQIWTDKLSNSAFIEHTDTNLIEIIIKKINKYKKQVSKKIQKRTQDDRV